MTECMILCMMYISGEWDRDRKEEKDEKSNEEDGKGKDIDGQVLCSLHKRSKLDLKSKEFCRKTLKRLSPEPLL